MFKKIIDWAMRDIQGDHWRQGPKWWGWMWVGIVVAILILAVFGIQI